MISLGFDILIIQTCEFEVTDGIRTQMSIKWPEKQFSKLGKNSRDEDQGVIHNEGHEDDLGRGETREMAQR